MATENSQGTCFLCGSTFDKKVMTKHLKSCVKEKASKEQPTRKKRSRKQELFHLLVEGRYLPEYWLHIEVPVYNTLEDLDSFLRDIWLECCGHLSAFTIDKTKYSEHPWEEYGEKGIDAKLCDVLRPRLRFYHEYDFGTTTHLALKVVTKREGKDEDIRLLARNNPPAIKCLSCGKPATQVCPQCNWENAGWLCDKCAPNHECGDEMLLPVVNSPRVGQCGYTGD